MTRKHFEAVAAALAKTRPDPINGSAATQWTETMLTVANALAETCPNFNITRFVNAAHA